MNGQTCILSRDGVEIMRGSAGDCWRWIHRNTCHSVAWACAYEGYRITEVASA